MWITGDPNCTISMCQGSNLCNNATTKGCCSYIAAAGQDPQCAQNQTNDECNNFVKTNGYTLKTWGSDADCVVTRENAGCQANKNLDNCSGKCTSSQTCKQQTDGSWSCVNNPAAATPATPATPAATTTGTPQTFTFTNQLQFNTVQDLLTKGLLPALQGIIVVLAIIFIVIGGILYITSTGDDKRMETAKACITGALIGLALAIAAPSFLKQISIILNWNGASAVSSAPTLSTIALNVLNFLLGIVGILAIIMMIVGGVMYLTSAGDEDRIDTAKKIILYSIIGIAVSLAALVIVRQIAALLT